MCELYRAWEGRLSVTTRQSHAAGGKLFVDFAGDGVPVVIDRLTGERRTAQIFRRPGRRGSAAGLRTGNDLGPFPVCVFVADLPEMGISFQAAPALMPGNGRRLRDGLAHLKQATDRVVAEIVKPQIDNAQKLARPRKCSADCIS
jgi:hypothetical protein